MPKATLAGPLKTKIPAYLAGTLYVDFSCSFNGLSTKAFPASL